MSRVVVGFDGSAHARRAVAWLARLRPVRGAVCTVVSVVEPVRIPAMGLLPASVRVRLAGEAVAMRAEAQHQARRAAEAAARSLTKAGWQSSIDVKEGVPSAELLKVVRTLKPDCVVVGARGVSAARRLLLGSVSAEVLQKCSVPVVVVK
jgi:nucleotide-binding universal stress UspA family protein